MQRCLYMKAVSGQCCPLLPVHRNLLSTLLHCDKSTGTDCNFLQVDCSVLKFVSVMTLATGQREDFD